MAKTNSEKAYDKGYEDSRQGRFDPPDGTSIPTLIGEQVFGRSEAAKGYDAGRDQEKADRK